MGLLRIRGRASGDSAASRAERAVQGADSYVERLLKLIPAEAIGIYLVGLQVVGAGNPETVARWSLACLVFVFLFRAIVSTESPRFGLGGGKGFRQWLSAVRSEAQWPAVLIACLSFVIWVSALGHPLAPYFSAGLNGCDSTDMAAPVVCAGERTGTLVLLLWTPLAAFLYGGDRSGGD